MQKSPPRVLMASRRLIEPKVSWASAYEFEDTVSAIDGVEQAAVKAIEVEPSRLKSRFLSRLQQTAGITAQREPRWDKMAVKGTYDLFFVRALGRARAFRPQFGALRHDLRAERLLRLDGPAQVHAVTPEDFGHGVH